MYLKGAIINANDLFSSAKETFSSLKQACHYIAGRPMIDRADWLLSVGNWNLDTMFPYETETAYYKRMRNMARGL